MSSVVVAGGTSVVGRALVGRLASAGHEVRVLSRSSTDLRADVTRPETLRGTLDGTDVLYSLVGASLAPRPLFPEQTFEAIDRDGNLALLAEAERAGVSRVVYLSVFGDYDRPLVYVDTHRAVEHALAASPIPSTAVRPTGFFGELAFLEAFRLLAPRVGDGSARTNPIHEEDLADVLAGVLHDGPAVLGCGGPEVLTRSEITARLAGSPVQVPVPPALLRLQAGLLRPVLPRLAAIVDFVGYVLTHDGIAPPTGSRTLPTPL
ncbi:MAG: NAD(P)H-binding protein [Alphaproteobacteria bacterium]|nr:NAD(P)H-binding protein [Alphaproteobacteria bacterium]MCB9673137.1 NAD(P)H-binding protein [Alphaproteobacteria bacterium]